MSSSWQQSASSKLNSLKTYIAQQTPPELKERAVDWKNRAGKTAVNLKGWTEQQHSSHNARNSGNVRRGNGNATASRTGGNGNEEKVWLFPGWAAAKPSKHRPRSGHGRETEVVEVEVYVSGYVSSLPPFSTSAASANGTRQMISSGANGQSRSTKAFLKLAKSFAGLPKLDAMPLSKPDEEALLLSNLHLPPRPRDISDDYLYEDHAEADELDEEALQRIEREFETLEAAASVSSSHYLSEGSSSNSRVSTSSSSYDFGVEAPSSSSNTPKYDDPTHVHKLHTNLETRLHPFWGSGLGNRTVRLSVFADGPEGPPLSTPKQIQTSPDGSFHLRYMVDHPGHLVAHLKVLAELLPTRYDQDDTSLPNFASPPSNPSLVQSQPQRHPPPTVSPWLPTIKPTTSSSLSVPLHPRPPFVSPGESQSNHNHIHLISDIDDTIKYTNVTGGARPAFYNVFVRDLHEVTIPAMSDWYRKLESKGVGFSYVSNSPFQLLPVICDFLEIANLPKGSLRLRSYTSKYLLSGLFSGLSSWSSPFASLTGAGAGSASTPVDLNGPEEAAASIQQSAGDQTNKKNDWATRKRSGVQEMLDAFKEAKFILVGDTGEADLEVYTELARERPEQVLAIFIRDVGMDDPDGVEPLPDPTGYFGDQALLPPSLDPGFSDGVTKTSRRAPPSLDLDLDDLVPPHPPFATSSRQSTPTSSRNSAALNTTYDTYTPRRTPRTPNSAMFGLPDGIPPKPKSASISSVSSISSELSGSTHSSGHGRSKDGDFGTKLTTEPESLLGPTPSSTSTLGPARTAPVTPMTPMTPRTPWTAHSNASLTSLKSIKSATSASISSIGSTLGARLNLTGPGNETDFERLQRLARQEAVRQQKAEEKAQANRERKRAVLQTRVYTARESLPRRIVLRVFRDPKECYEDCVRIGVL
ncbi:hypothetical protein GYMLUDRAFT_42472 [Collybiopsis luxurians FD-317 M1]|uniref:Phosphatidate phosphatase APP1 catalytic domain-containing protein n=1 Tax=Collybiopsis luxurians FD-317 M1 TaxID=944289 RepID=A0A0D0CZN2_9AGAR|nr:hypothetical protein GYMLUDRAFT_42472 [Collybiopsis luxurians FD-317 M1]